MKEQVLTVLNELRNITQQITNDTEQEQFESLPLLIQKRDSGIQQLKSFNANEFRDAASGVVDSQIKSAFEMLNTHSHTMQETMTRKSKSLLSTLSSLQQRRYYTQEVSK